MSDNFKLVGTDTLEKTIDKLTVTDSSSSKDHQDEALLGPFACTDEYDLKSFEGRGVFHSIQRDRIRKTQYFKDNKLYLIKKKSEKKRKKDQQTPMEERISSLNRKKLHFRVYLPQKRKFRDQSPDGNNGSYHTKHMSLLQKKYHKREMNRLKYGISIGSSFVIVTSLTRLQKITGKPFSYYDGSFDRTLTDILEVDTIKNPDSIYISNTKKHYAKKIAKGSQIQFVNELPEQDDVIDQLVNAISTYARRRQARYQVEALTTTEIADSNYEKYLQRLISEWLKENKKWYNNPAYEFEKGRCAELAVINMFEKDKEISRVSLFYHTRFHIRMNQLYRIFEIRPFKSPRELITQISNLNFSFSDEQLNGNNEKRYDKFQQPRIPTSHYVNSVGKSR